MVGEDADEEQADEEMDASGSGGTKRKAEDIPAGESMEVVDCVCEDAGEVNAVGEEGLE